MIAIRPDRFSKPVRYLYKYNKINNLTEKTYARYAIYGFLENWKENIRFKLNQNEIENLSNNGVIELNLQSFEREIPIILDELSKRYTQVLPNILQMKNIFLTVYFVL